MIIEALAVYAQGGGGNRRAGREKASAPVMARRSLVKARRSSVAAQRERNPAIYIETYEVQCHEAPDCCLHGITTFDSRGRHSGAAMLIMMYVHIL